MNAAEIQEQARELRESLARGRELRATPCDHCWKPAGDCTCGTVERVAREREHYRHMGG